MQVFILTILGAVLFVILDFIWFYFAGNFFKSEIGSIARLTPEGEWNVRYVPALFVYLLMGLGISVFVYPHVAGLGMAFLLGALFGFIGYGLYDLTNLATLTDWTVRFAIVDMIWGTLLCGTVSSLLYLVGKTWL